jgi:hypothetical protein
MQKYIKKKNKNFPHGYFHKNWRFGGGGGIWYTLTYKKRQHNLAHTYAGYIVVLYIIHYYSWITNDSYHNFLNFQI